MNSVSRRRFLAFAAGAGGLAALGSVRWLGQKQGRAVAEQAGLQAVRQTSCALGAVVTITALHRSAPVASSAIAAAFAELTQIERVMSLYRPDSEISRLNRAGHLDSPHPYLLTVLHKAQDLARQSDGAFDVTVQPLWDLYVACRHEHRAATQADIDAVRDRVDYRKIELSPHRIRLTSPNMAITLNGIAQGFAADRVLAVLREHNIEHALVDTGEIGSLGRKATGQPWVAGIQHPRKPDAYLSLAALDGRCLSTSGDYATTFNDDFTMHHIFDPATGGSPQSLASVTVVAPAGIDADALSTAVFVLGPQKGRQLVDVAPGADALLVCKDGTVIATDNFPLAPEGPSHA